MIDDFKPATRRAKPLRAAIDNLPQRQTPNPNLPFQTPDTVAAHDTLPPSGDTTNSVITSVSDGKGFLGLKRHFRKPKIHWPPNRKEIIIGCTIILLISSGLGSWFLLHHDPKPVAATPKIVIVKPKPVVPTTVPSTLSGLPVEPIVNTRPITGVMIENSLDARPQAGLSEPGVVFEAIAEGGITRFLTLFQDTQPDNIGPIRSSRPYYLQWALGFDATYAHVGGSPEALADIKAWGVKDLDQFYNGGSYHRISTRAAPHNVYTGVATLSQLGISKGYTASSFKGWLRKADKPLSVPTAKAVDFAISGPSYNAHYDYDVASNSYKRSEGGAAHIDANTNTQLSPKVVIGLVLPYSLESDGYHSNYNTLGSGQAYIFQDGAVTIGSWNKADNASPLVFIDAAGKPLALNAGQTWLSAVKAASNITFSP
ncbi:MAG: DUF3048 domain-containing protein [Candidatus Saccharibacteria bacterium]